MKQQIIDLFTATGKFKLTFNPAIKIQPAGQKHPVWIDDMSRVNSSYIITVSTHDDNCKRNLDSLSNDELAALHKHLSLKNKKQAA